jgi:predicted HTH transcriptional regulator
MDFKTLKTVVAQGEDQFTEFKLKSNHPEKIAREMVAFANSEGGLLIIGVSDDLEIKGLKYADEDLYLLEKTFDKVIEPPIRYEIHRIGLENEKEVLAFEVFSEQNPPHYLLIENEKKLYVRHKDKALQANKEMREIIKAKQKNRTYRFSYGDKEKELIKYLDSHESITVSIFSKLANISPQIASRTLVLLVLAGLLNISPQEHEDHFILKDHQLQ